MIRDLFPNYQSIGKAIEIIKVYRLEHLVCEVEAISDGDSCSCYLANRQSAEARFL